MQFNAALTCNAPGTSGPQDEDDRVGLRVAELVAEWDQNSQKLAEAAEHVLGYTSWAEHSAQSVASLMLGHPDDQASRDKAFCDDLRQRVLDELHSEAEKQAEKESKNWPSWRQVQRQQTYRGAA